MIIMIFHYRFYFLITISALLIIIFKYEIIDNSLAPSSTLFDKIVHEVNVIYLNLSPHLIFIIRSNHLLHTYLVV
jgi:hypothetical protein